MENEPQTMAPEAPSQAIPEIGNKYRKRFNPAQIVGLALIAAAVGTCVSEHFRPHPEHAALIKLGILAAGAVGGWFLVQAQSDFRTLSASCLALALSGLGFGLSWPCLSLPALGVGIGAGIRWGLARQKRARWFTIAVACGCYVVSAIAALVHATNQQGLLWVMAQGLGSLAAGYALSYAPAVTESPSMRKAAQIAGRCLLIAGVALPYIALILLVGAK